MTHAARIEKSSRLQRTLAALADGKAHTTAEIAHLTGSMAVHTDVHELRRNGYDVACQYVGRSPTGRKVYAYRLKTEPASYPV